jgi:anaerobic selenocysteine-containing dehydrogenase
MSKTCDYANYVIAPKIHYETHGLTALNEMLGGFGAGWGFDETYAQVCNPIMDPPKGSDLCEGHEFFHAMAAHLDRPLHIRSFAWVNDPHTQAANLTIINPKDKVNGIDAWNAALNGAPISVKDAFADPEMHKGKVTATNGIEIQPKPTGWTGKLMIGELHMMSEIERFKTERLSSDYDTSSSRFPYRLISRRLNDIHNSNWHEVPGLRKRLPHHPAYINPKDMVELKLSEGDIVKITSEISSIKCVVTAAPDVRVGCLAVPHSWGTNTDEIDDPLGAGGNTGRLSPVDKNFDKITGIPLMSAIPVNLELA